MHFILGNSFLKPSFFQYCCLKLLLLNGIYNERNILILIIFYFYWGNFLFYPKTSILTLKNTIWGDNLFHLVTFSSPDCRIHLLAVKRCKENSPSFLTNASARPCWTWNNMKLIRFLLWQMILLISPLSIAYRKINVTLWVWTNDCKTFVLCGFYI